MSMESGHKHLGYQEFLITILLLLGGAMTYIYIGDREDWRAYQRQQEVNFNLLDTRMKNLDFQQTNYRDATREELMQIRRTQERLWEKYDNLRSNKK